MPYSKANDNQLNNDTKNKVDITKPNAATYGASQISDLFVWYGVTME